jgi:hypothetical protein
MQAEVDLPLATMGERLITCDTVVKGRTKAADLHPELVASWPGGASWPPAPEVAADRIRVRRIRRIAATALFVAGDRSALGLDDSPARPPAPDSQYLPIGVAQAAGALVALAGIGMIMLSRGVLRGQRRSWMVAVALLAASLALHLVHARRHHACSSVPASSPLLIVQRERFRAQTEQGTDRLRLPDSGRRRGDGRVGAFVGVEVAGRVHHHPLPGWPDVLSGRPNGSSGCSRSPFPPHQPLRVISLLAVGISWSSSPCTC